MAAYAACSKSSDLERIGDLATNLGEYSLEADRDGLPRSTYRTLPT